MEPKASNALWKRLTWSSHEVTLQRNPMASLLLQSELEFYRLRMSNLPACMFNLCGHTLHCGFIDITQHEFRSDGTDIGSLIHFRENGEEAAYLNVAHWSAVSFPIPAPPPSALQGRRVSATVAGWAGVQVGEAHRLSALLYLQVCHCASRAGCRGSWSWQGETDGGTGDSDFGEHLYSAIL